MAPREDGPWGVREIAKGVEMNPSTVHRLLGLLEEEGLVRQDDPGGGYGLGTELLRLAWTAAGSHPVRSAALPHMRELAAASGETVTLRPLRPRQAADVRARRRRERRTVPLRLEARTNGATCTRARAAAR